MGLLIPCSFVLAAAFCPSPIRSVPENIATNQPGWKHAFPALQIHQPTKEGNVTHIQPEEPPVTQSAIKLDPAQLQREAQELLELSQSLQVDIESLNHGLHPKETLDKLKRIQKLAKHLRGEIAP